jgi:hypothetical protein
VSTPPARRGAGTEPGELGASDLRLVNDLHEFVVTTRGRWREEPTVPIAEAPPVVVDGPAGNAHLDDTIDFDSDAGEQTPGKLDDDVRTVRGDRLTPLTLAEIEVDGRPTTVVITEIEPDRRSPSPSTAVPFVRWRRVASPTGSTRYPKVKPFRPSIDWDPLHRGD